MPTTAPQTPETGGLGSLGSLGLMLPTMPQGSAASPCRRAHAGPPDLPTGSLDPSEPGAPSTTWATGTGLPSAAALAAAAAGAEAAGAAGVWACDHLFWHTPVVECLTALAIAAAATERCAVGSSVLQLPLRDATVVAKQASSLQQLSAGRAVLGLGVGSHPGEYAAAGHDFAARGRRLDDQVAELRRLWAADPVPDGPSLDDSDRGRYRQRPAGEGPPIWFGGSSTAALERTARQGDGWMPLFLDPDQYTATRADLARRCETVGRDPDGVVPALVVFVSLAAGGADGEDEAMARGTGWMSSLYRLPPRAFARHLVAGTARRCAERLAQWFAAGAAHVVIFVTDDEPLVQFSDLSTALSGVLGADRMPGPTPTPPPRGTLSLSTAPPSDSTRRRAASATEPTVRAPADRTDLAATPGPSPSEAAGGRSW